MNAILDLFLNLDAASGNNAALFENDTSSQRKSGRLSLIAADLLNLRVWPMRPGINVAAAPTSEALAAGTVMAMAARPASNPNTGDVLFFATLTPAAGEDYWEGDLNLNTTAILDTLTGSTTQIIALVDIELQNAGNTERVTYQFEAVIKAQALHGDEGVPADAEPPYPAVDQLVLKQGDGAWYRFGNDGHLYLYHQPTGLWHTVQLQLVESVVTITVNQTGVATVP